MASAYSDNIVIIEALRNAPFIWNRDSQDFKNKPLKDNFWRGLSQSTEKTVPELKKKWKYLMDTFEKEIKKDNSKWAYLDHLRFLLAKKRRPLRGNLPSAPVLPPSQAVPIDVQPSTSAAGSSLHIASEAQQFDQLSEAVDYQVDAPPIVPNLTPARQAELSPLNSQFNLPDNYRFDYDLPEVVVPPKDRTNNTKRSRDIIQIVNAARTEAQQHTERLTTAIDRVISSETMQQVSRPSEDRSITSPGYRFLASLEPFLSGLSVGQSLQLRSEILSLVSNFIESYDRGAFSIARSDHLSDFQFIGSLLDQLDLPSLARVHKMITDAIYLRFA